MKHFPWMSSLGRCRRRFSWRSLLLSTLFEENALKVVEEEEEEEEEETHESQDALEE